MPYQLKIILTAIGFMLSAQSAHASATFSVWTDEFTLTTFNVTGGQVTYSPVAQDARYYNGNLNSTIKTDLANQFNISSSSLTDVSPGLVTVSGQSMTITGGKFDFLGVHVGGGEFIFHWAQNLSSSQLFTLTTTGHGLSNYETWTDHPVSAVPVPAAIWLFASGLLGLGALRKKSKA